MKRIFLLFIQIILILNCVSCTSYKKEILPTPTPSIVKIEVKPVITNNPTILIEDTPNPTSTPSIKINEQWYTERNETIAKFMRQYNPELSEQDINSRVGNMSIDPDKPMVSLTFDDGPFPGVTEKILDILEKYNVRATFFVCGWRFKDEAAKDIARRALSLGCEIGNHTYAHKDMDKQDSSGVLNSVKSGEKAIFDATGYTVHGIRPPGGHNSYTATSYAEKNNMAIILWSQSGNVHETDPEKIAQNVEKQIVNGKELQDGDIILLHDTKPYMVDAIEIIVPKLLEQGYQLVTVWELVNCSENGFVPGQIYHKQEN